VAPRALLRAAVRRADGHHVDAMGLAQLHFDADSL
jgi:hypothetical protein